VRTLSEDSMGAPVPRGTPESMVSVGTKRYGEGGKSLENLVVIARWEQPPDERCG
jgi:hypothetical protein